MPVRALHALLPNYMVLPAIECHTLPAYRGSMEHLLMAQQLGTTIFALRQMPADVVGKTRGMAAQCRGCVISIVTKGR